MADLNVDVVDGVGTDIYARVVRRRLARTERRGESDLLFEANTVQDMVNRILNGLGPANRLRRLRIFGHGNEGQQGVGNSRRPALPQIIMVRCLGHAGGVHCGSLTNQIHLQRLSGRFAAGGWAELHGCDVGDGREGLELLRRLAALWNVPVKASEDTQRPRNARHGLSGLVVAARPDGTIYVPED
jgi:hypothetical protein